MDIVDSPPAPSPPSPDAPPPAPAVVLHAAGLRRAFGKVPAVDGLDLTVRAGEIYGFLGINGAGKTTTIRMLMGIIKPDAGSIELLGRRTARTSIEQKQRIGYVSQEQTFYPWMTCRGLGRFVGGLYPTWDAAEFDRLLRVLELPPDRKASQLSGGMRVKLALALALAPRPALLILDEPTAGLDPVARREFLDIIHRQARDHQRTTFFSSHLIDEVERVADRVGIIHRGRMRYEGDLQTLRDTVRRVRLSTERAAVAPASQPASPAGSKTGAPMPEELTVPTLINEMPAVDAEPPADSAMPPPLPVPPPSPAEAFTLPPRFDVLRDETRDGFRSLILRAPGEAWEQIRPPDAEVSRLSLEDIFIALVGSGTIAV